MSLQIPNEGTGGRSIQRMTSRHQTPSSLAPEVEHGAHFLILYYPLLLINSFGCSKSTNQGFSRLHTLNPRFRRCRFCECELSVGGNINASA
jgi:hypothetical protein